MKRTLILLSKFVEDKDKIDIPEVKEDHVKEDRDLIKKEIAESFFNNDKIKVKNFPETFVPRC